MAAKAKQNDPDKSQTPVYRTQSYNDMFDAIGEGNSDKVLSILQTTKDPIGLMKKKDLQGLTPLRKAIALNEAEIARMLITEGADASQRGALDKVALHDSALVGQRLLIAPLLSSPNVSVNSQDKFGMTPLHNAVRGKHIKAVEWLVFAGADVNITNDHDKSPLDLCRAESDNETERQIHKILEAHRAGFDSIDLALCCGYIGKKEISKMDPDGSLMFVTSDLWPDDPQFVFGIKVNPSYADPQIPLRTNERCYCDVYRYRLMIPLPKDQRRVKIYFTILEELKFSELILKVCSKSRYLGEIPVSITSYPYQRYTNYLGVCEMDLQNEGQFVLVKRPSLEMLRPDAYGILEYYMIPLFKLAASKQLFPGPPPNWNKTRRQREWDECQMMVEALQKKDTDDAPENSSNNMTNNALDSAVRQNQNTNAEEKNQEELVETPEVPEEEGPILLDWSEPDLCEDFYYISRGWGCYLDYRRSLDIAVIQHKFRAEIEEPVARCFTDFFRLCHSSNTMKGNCLAQFPKNPGFVKEGIVFVLQREGTGPEEKEDPLPDDTTEEFFISEDGRHTNGQVWMLKEMKRWSLLKTGIINRPTRIIFTASKLCTYVGVQLLIGEEKWDAEEDSDDDSDDSSMEGEGEDDGEAEDDGEGGEVKKKKKKKHKDKEAEDDEEANNEGDDKNENALNFSRSKNKVQRDENVSNSVRDPSVMNSKTMLDDDVDVEETISRGVEPIDEEFAMGIDELVLDDTLEDDTSSETLGQAKMKRVLSICIGNTKEDGFEEFTFGPPKKQEEIEEDQWNTLIKEVALLWRCRNHRQAKVLVFTRYRAETYFDMVLELVQESDLSVRAESRWTEGFKMVASSESFITLTGRLFTFGFEGTMTIESPAETSQPLMFYSIDVNELYYVVKRQMPDEPVLPGKKAKKKEEPNDESNEVDTILEVTGYPQGTRTDGADILKMAIPLTGPNLWKEEHLHLREPDNVLLSHIVKQLIDENIFATNWWKIWILLEFDEKQVEVEKVKQDWPGISEMMLWKWFQVNIDSKDRGIARLIYILDSLKLDLPIFRLIGELKKYKLQLGNELKPPRQLDLLFHWVIKTKMTTKAFQRRAAASEPPVYNPMSDQFLLYMNELLNPDIFLDMGPLMDLEDNVMHSINGEENIIDPGYKTFKVLMKSKQRKDEIVGFTLMLTEMVKTLEQTAARDFLVRETRRWMTSVIETEPDTCTKLENILDNDESV